MKYAYSILMILSLLAAPLVGAQQLPNSFENISVDATIIESSEPGAPVQKIQAGYFEGNEAQVEKVLQETINSNKQAHSQVVITTDSPTLYAGVEKQLGSADSNVIGVLTSPETKDSILRKSFRYVKNSVKMDPIGVMVTTVVVGADIWMWIHASQYSNMTIAGQVLTNLVVNLGMGLRKNAWAEANNKLANKVFNPLLKTVGFKNLTSSRAELMIKMISNFTMVLTVQAVRLGFITLGGSSHVLMGGHNYSYTDVAIKAGITSFLVATAFSFNSFGWSNWIDKITKNETLNDVGERGNATQVQKGNRIAKFLAYRFYETRALFVGMHVTSAALMSTNIYGYSAWTWAAVHGTIGLASYLSSGFNTKILLAAGHKIATISTRFSEKSFSFKKLFGTSSLKCEAVFSI